MIDFMLMAFYFYSYLLFCLILNFSNFFLFNEFLIRVAKIFWQNLAEKSSHKEIFWISFFCLICYLYFLSSIQYLRSIFTVKFDMSLLVLLFPYLKWIVNGKDNNGCRYLVPQYALMDGFTISIRHLDHLMRRIWDTQ